MMIFVLIIFVMVTSSKMINKEYIEPKDQFICTCNMKEIHTDQYRENIREVRASRKVGNDPYYQDMAIYRPFRKDMSVEKSIIPPGRVWDIKFSGGSHYSNRGTIQISIRVFDAVCTDDGRYQCSFYFDDAAVEGLQSIAKLKSKEPIVQGAMSPLNIHGRLSSENQVGELITLTCTASGPSTLRTAWTFTNKTSTKEEKYFVRTNVMLFNPEKAFDCNRCSSHFHMTRLKFTLGRADDGTTFYCSVLTNDTVNKKAQFTVYVKEPVTVN